MIFHDFKNLPHSRKIENSHFLDFNGLLIVTFTSKTENMVRIQLKKYSVTCFYTYSVYEHHVYS